MVALNNLGASGSTISLKVPNSPFSPNQRICNIFWPEDDCFNVNSDGSVNVVLLSGEAKVYVRESDLPVN